MQFTHLGRSGLSVSRLCLGTMNFGPQTDEPDAHSIMDSALDSGINFFDTANVYGGTEHRGWTEEIVGRWFASGGERRDRTVLATKLYGTMTDRPNESKLSALNIRRALDASLRRLQTDYIDLYQFHHVDRDTPWDEIWQAIEVAVQQGKILYCRQQQLRRLAHRAGPGRRGSASLHRPGQRAVHLQPARPRDRARSHSGRAVTTAWASSRGHRCRAACSAECCARRAKAFGGSRAGRGSRLEAHRDQIQQYEDLADELGHPPGDVALAWLLAQPAVTAPIIGPRTQEQLDAALRALDVELDDKTLTRLDEIFPGHRTAPEDYAW